VSVSFTITAPNFFYGASCPSSMDPEQEESEVSFLCTLTDDCSHPPFLFFSARLPLSIKQSGKLFENIWSFSMIGPGDFLVFPELQVLLLPELPIISCLLS